MSIEEQRVIFGDYYFDYIFNVDAITDSKDKIENEKELVELLIQTRYDDLLDIPITFNIDIGIDDHPLIQTILLESSNDFRNMLRDAVTLATILANYDRNDSVNISLQGRMLRNKIKINLDVPINIELKDVTASDYEGAIITFESLISNWSKKRVITHTAEYKCPECDYTKTRPFKGKMLKEDSCPDHAKFLEFNTPILSEDTRRITLREINDDFSDGKLPSSISADIYGKNVSEVELSDKVVVTGIFRSVPLRIQDGKIRQEFMPTIQIVSTQNKNKDKIELPDDELIEKFKNMEREGKLIKNVIDGFAYNIYKKRNEKKAVLCSLIGSQWRGQVGKGNPPMIHILFVGDPDTYKSTIMKYIINVSDNCVLADSTTVSNAGIKAIAVKMDDGRWSIMAGLLPTHSGGVVFLDEFGDLKQDIYADLKAPMIDGRVSKHVAGEDFSGKAETGILASMNPTEGVYDDSKTLYENLVVLPKPLITRFDIIFKFSKNSPDYDSKGIRDHFKECDMYGKPKEYLTDHEIKLFINYVKDKHVEVTDDAHDRSNEFFAAIEKKGGEKGGTETRTENAVMKFAIALAKWHMDDFVSAKHVNESIELYEYSLDTFNMKMENGELINEENLKKTEDGRKTAIDKAWKKLKNDDGYAFEDDVITEALNYKCFKNRGEAETLMGKLALESQYTTKDNMIKFSWKK